MAAERYAFDGFILDVPERRLLREGQAVSLSPKAFDVLVVLVRDAGRLRTKREILDSVWPEAFVEEGILSVHVAALRRALNDAQPPRFIETVRRSGYRFAAGVSPLRGASRGGAQERLIGLADALTDRARARVYELCGIGRQHLSSASMREVPAAVDAFKAAIAIDPSYAPAHAGHALACCAQASMRVLPPQEAYRDAKTAALRALAMDESCADAQVALGTVLFFAEWDWAGAERCFGRALETQPDHQQACLIYGRLLDTRRRPDEALAVKLRALAAEPRSPLVHLQIALTYWNRRDYNQAMSWAEKALSIDPQHLLAREFVVGACQQLGDHDRAMLEAMRHAESFGVSQELLQPLKDAYAAGGRPAVVKMALDQGRRGGAPALQLAVLSAESGDADAALRYLDAAIDSRDPSLVDLAVAPQWDALRADSRFAARLIRMGL